jgi:recombination protein RecT
LECTTESFAKAIIEASELGLEPGSMIGGVHLVPYWNSKRKCNEVQSIVDYRGLMDLARRSGEVELYPPVIAYENEEFEVVLGLNPDIRHKPKTTGDRGDPIAVYCVARLSSGDKIFDWMTMEEVEQHRARSKASDAGPWVDDYNAMTKKTIIRRFCKMLPRSTQLQKALEIEDRAEFQPEAIPTEFINLSNATAEDELNGTSQTERVKGKLKMQAKPPQDGEEDAESQDSAEALVAILETSGFSLEEAESYSQAHFQKLVGELNETQTWSLVSQIKVGKMQDWLLEQA